MIALDEQELFRIYAQSKQLQIERLLDQYGTSLSDMRELYPKLTETIQKQRMVTTLPTEPVFFTPSEAVDMGLSLEEGWMLKISPTEGGYKSSFITPSKWEITEDELYISPEGTQYSKADLEALLSPPSGGLEGVPAPLSIEDLTEQGQQEYQAYQEAGGQLGIAAWIELREREYLETEQIFGKVFPEKDIAEVITYIQDNPEGFQADMRELGWTADTEAFLRSIYPEITIEDMRSIFGQVAPYIPESAWKDFQDALQAGAVATIQNIGTWLLTQPAIKPTRETLEAWATRTTAINPALMQNAALYEQYVEPGVQLRYEQALARTAESYLRRREQQQQYWIDHPELVPNPEYLQNPFQNPSLFLDPGYIAYTIGSSLAYSLAVMGTIVAVSAVATPFVGIPAGVMVAAMPEAGAMLDQLIAMGVPVEEARQKAFLGGLIAGGVEAVSDLPFIGLVFKPLRPVVQPLIKTIQKVTVNALAKAVITGLTIPQIEGLEEVVTQMAQNAILQHYDETQSILEGVSHAYIQAVIASLPFGVIGGAASYRTFRSNLSPELGKQLDDLVTNLQNKGLTEEQAQVQAVNELARDTQNEVELSQAIEAAQQEYLESQGVKSVEELIPDQGIAGDILDEIKIAEGIKVTPTATAVPSTAKEPWQMTRAEFETWYKERFAAPDLQGHKVRVMQALEQGKPVPAEVLKDYPDLKGVTTEGALSEGVRGLSPADALSTKAEMGTLADYTDDVSLRTFLGKGTKYWSLATYNKAKAGQSFKIYRAVPTDITDIHLGAWVTQNREYAQFHLKSVLRGEGHIIEGTAKANELVAMAENEFFYVPESALPQAAEVPSKVWTEKDQRLLNRLRESYNKLRNEYEDAKIEVASAERLTELARKLRSLDEEIWGMEWEKSGAQKEAQATPQAGTAEVPTTPPGMPEQGLQAGIPGMAAAEVVRPQPTGKLVQAKIDDYLRLREYNAKAAESRIAEIKKLLETKGRLPKGQGTKGDLRLELARLEAQQSLDTVESIGDLDTLIKEVETELGNREVNRGARKLFKDYTTRQLEEMRNVYLQAREKMQPNVPELKPTPKPELTEAEINRVKTDPTPASDEQVLKKFIECIKDAKPAREVTEVLKHEELSNRAAVFASILRGGEGSKAFEKAKSALKGFLPRAEYLLDLEAFGITNAEIERMIDQIRTDNRWRPFQKLNTYEAFINLVMGGIPTEGQLLLLERQFGSELAKAVLDKMSTTSEKAIRIAQDIANIPRTLVTIADLSATLRQGAVLAFGQPVQFAEAFKAELQVVFSEKNFKLINEIVHNNVYAESAEQHGLYIAPIEEAVKIEAREEAYRGRLIERIPLLGSIIRASERAYITFLNVLRIATYAYYCRQWEGTGKTANDYDKLAAFINHATGRGDLGSFSRAGSWLSAVFFSPRYIMSRLEVPLDLINTTPAVRKVIARNLVSFVGANLLAIMLFKLAGADTEDDPRSADFGKIKIGDTRIDLWAGYLPYVRVIAQIITEERKSTKTGEVYTIDPIDVGVNFFRSKLAPLPGFLWDLKAGQTFIGEELSAENAEKIIFEKLTPMFIQDLIEAVRESGIAGIGYGILSGLGVGIQTYSDSDNWENIQLKLGLPQRDENLPYTVVNEVYDVEDYYSDVGKMIGGATYKMLSEKKNIPPLVLSVAQARDIIREINLLPNKRLTNINADPMKGDTFEQFRVQWLARQKITDREELKQFDKDYPDAFLGNISQAQYALLVEYHSLPEADKAEFLGWHPELYINPREEWLRTHPQENALLALWGKADPFSPEAQSKVSTLATQLGIPENALVLKDLDKVTELKLKNQSLFDLLEAYGGLDDTLKGPDGLTARDRAIQQLYLDNPDFRDDQRRIEALNVGTKDNPTLEDMVEGWVERGQIADEFGPSSAEMKLWLIDNKEVHQWALENALLSDTGEKWNENILRLQVNYREDFDKYDNYGKITSPLYISNDDMRADAREAMLFDKKGMTSFGVAYYTINALQKDIPENLIGDYVGYFGIRKKENVDYSAGWYEDDWFLIENKEFYDTMVSLGEWQPRDFSKVPTRQVYSLYKTYMGLPEGEPRKKFRIDNVILDAWLVVVKKYSPASDATGSIISKHPEQFLAYLQ